LIWFKKFNVFQNGIFIEQPPYGLKDERLRARVAASMFSGDSAAAGLAGNPYPALAEMLKLSALVRHQLPNVTAPCLLIHASEDDVANVSNSLLVQKKLVRKANSCYSKIATISSPLIVNIKKSLIIA